MYLSEKGPRCFEGTKALAPVGESAVQDVEASTHLRIPGPSSARLDPDPGVQATVVELSVDSTGTDHAVMVALEQIAAQVVTLRRELSESRRREEALNTRLQAAQSTGATQAALQEMVNTQKAILEASKKPDKKLTLVDNRSLAKPRNFDGWDEGDSGWYGDWTEDPGSNPENNLLVLGALHRARTNMGSKKNPDPKKETQPKAPVSSGIVMDLKTAMKRLTAEDKGGPSLTC